VVGAGNVGLSNAVLLARLHDVTLLDVDAAKTEAINARRQHDNLHLKAIEAHADVVITNRVTDYLADVSKRYTHATSPAPADD